MKQLCQSSIFALGAIALFSLFSDVVSDATTTLARPEHASSIDAIAVVGDARTSLTGTDVSRTWMAQVTGLLSPEQTAQLTRLPIPIVAPTYLPAGFRVVHAEGEAGTYANGDDDSGYAIDYEGENNTCLSLRSSQEGSRGLKSVSQVQTRFGLITVYVEKFRDRMSLVSFLRIKGNPILISGGALPDSSAKGGFKLCRAVSLEIYTQVLKSLAVLK